MKNTEGIPAAQMHYLHVGDDSRMRREYGYGEEQNGYNHVKRKSDFLLSLYGLPYTLVNKREDD